MSGLTYGPVLGAVAGFCSRPCCIVPALMSVTGFGGVALSQAVVTHRWMFMTASGAMLGAALWTTLRRDGGWLNKALAIGATTAGFAVSLRVLEIL